MQGEFKTFALWMVTLGQQEVRRDETSCTFSQTYRNFCTFQHMRGICNIRETYVSSSYPGVVVREAIATNGHPPRT
jgi:hypothetical protein